MDAGADGDDDAHPRGVRRRDHARTRLVSLSHVLWTTGAVMPVAAIAALAHDRGAFVVVDGAQAAGAIPFRFDELGADAYAVPAQKWLLGPEGMGALVVDPGAIERLVPALGGWFTFERGEQHRSARAGGPTPAGSRRPASTGRRSSGWPARSAGCRCSWASSSSIGAGRRWPRRPRRASPAIPGVTVLTPRHAMATLVTFRIAGWPAEAALDELGSRVFAVARTIEPPRRDPDQRRVLHHGRRAGALRRGGRAPGRQHARDAAAAARPDDPRARDERPPRSGDDAAAPVVGGDPLAPVPARAAAGRARGGGRA